jgi:hypothetical protein
MRWFEEAVAKENVPSYPYHTAHIPNQHFLWAQHYLSTALSARYARWTDMIQNENEKLA